MNTANREMLGVTFAVPCGITLGAIIDALESVHDKTKWVQFDFGGFAPDDVASYRGYYDNLAIGWRKTAGEYETVADLLPKLSEAVGKTYSGYKGGDYTMTRETPVWAAQWSESTSTAIVGVTEHSWVVILDTRFID